MIGLSELAQHVACNCIHVGLVMGVVQLPIYLGRLLAWRGKGWMLGDGIVSLQHTVGVKEVCNLTESRDVHHGSLDGCGSLTHLVLADLGIEFARTGWQFPEKCMEMPLVIETEEGALVLGFHFSET